MKRIKAKVVYEIFMMILALTVVVLTLLDITVFIKLPRNNFISITNTIIYGIFVIDFIVRLLFSKNKWQFITQNKLDSLVIIPYGAFLRVFSVFKILKLSKILQLSKIFRATVYFENFLKKLTKIIKTNIISLMILVILTVILTCAGFISIIEDIKFADALWWSFVTATTVGYGDISPRSNLGRAIAVVLMITGVVSMGVLSGVVASYFLKRELNNKIVTCEDEIINNIKGRLDSFNNLSEDDIKDIYNVLSAMKKGK